MKVLFTSGPAQLGSVIYDDQDQSIVSSPINPDDRELFIINDIVFYINPKSEISSVQGLCPRNSWISDKISIPSAVNGKIIVTGQIPAEPTVIRLNNFNGHAPCLYDVNNNILLIRLKQRDKTVVRVHSGLLLGIDGVGDITSAWFCLSNFS